MQGTLKQNCYILSGDIYQFLLENDNIFHRERIDLLQLKKF